MPISWRISDGLVRITSIGEVYFGEWRAAVDAALSDAHYRPGMGVVHDWRGLHEAPSAQEIHARAEYGARLRAMRWALVVQNEKAYGTGRLAELLVGILAEPPSVELRVFHSRVEAAVWASSRDRRPRESRAAPIP